MPRTCSSASRNAVCGAYDDVILPRQGEQHDSEVGLTVVIGRPTRAVAKEEAMEYVAGYTIANDICTSAT